MWKRTAYYLLKPYLPRKLRIATRSFIARRKARSTRSVWPIDPSAASAPVDWTGWPEQKTFAFVLTHDVEGPRGLANVRKLAELEIELGLRSSFNFIPAGPYQVPDQLRSWLVENGFEVGVHDLRHNGKLFNEREQFRRDAGRINHFLTFWNAVGFRSGFMLRNLEWIHDLRIEYDASTFDTDPFEPQSEGANTIYPFFVHGPDGGGYVELPYTLPQDSTLFLLLRETDDHIWRTKLDWIVQNGALALVNVHPDYLSFSEPHTPYTFPVGVYTSFLRHTLKRFAGSGWFARPCDIARWFRRTHVGNPARALSPAH